MIGMLATGCGAGAQGNAGQSPTATIRPATATSTAAVPAPPPGPSAASPTATSLSAATATRQPAPAATATPGRAAQAPLFLTVVSPADESEVATAQCLVRGRTAPGAIVSVNGELAAVDARGEFTHMVTLVEGANVIEIIASDVTGAEVRDTLLLDYAP